MNNEEAKEIIENLCTVDEVSIVETDIEALHMGIKALDREETILKALEDVRAEIEASQSSASTTQTRNPKICRQGKSSVTTVGWKQ